MSKKQLQNRLDKLFAGLENQEAPRPTEKAESLPSWSWECDTNGIYKVCTPEVKECLGINPESFVGQSIYSFAVAPQYAEVLKSSFNEIQTPTTVDVYLNSAEGSYIPVKIHISPQQNLDGTISGFQGHFEVLKDFFIPVSENVPEAPAFLQPEPVIQPVEVSRQQIGTPITGVAIEAGQASATQEIWSITGKNSHTQNQAIFQQAIDGSLAAIAIPVELQQQAPALLEILADKDKTTWSEDEKQLVQEVATQLSLALENARLYSEVLRLFEQTQLSLSETELLYKVTNGIALASDAPDLVRLVAEHIMPKVATRCVLFVVKTTHRGEVEELEIAGSYDTTGQELQIGTHIPLAALPLVNSLENDPYVIPDVFGTDTLDTNSRQTLMQLNITSACLVPLRSAGRLMGILMTSSSEPATYDPDDIRRLQVIGNGIGVALEKQILLREAQRRAVELQTAAEVARDTTSTLSMDTMLSRIVDAIAERFSFYQVSLFMVDSTGNFAVIKEASGAAGEEMKKNEHKFAIGSKSVIGMVTQSSEPVILNNVSESPLFWQNPLLPETRSEIGLPLKIQDQTIGALDIHSNSLNAFAPNDVAVLRILADQISVAIKNAEAFELSQQAILELHEVDRIKNQFLANMSHELRTPLNSIIGFSRVILKGIDGPVNDMQSQDLGAIYNSGQHLLSLINNILDLSKIDAGKMELQIADVNLTEIINAAASTASGLVKDKPIKLNQIVPENLPTLQADSTRIRQVLLNFVSNAAKFTDQGSITIEALQSTSPDGTPEIMVKVTDTGTGIEEKDRTKLFQPFSQVDDSPTRKAGGTGLGLSISRSLIEMHKGRIGLLWSELGKGSCFFFALPLPHKQTMILNESGFLSLTSNAILAIDDDIEVLNLYERFLKPHGFNVVNLTNPQKAVERAKQVRPFAITLDVMMPQKDGWQVIKELKSDPDTKNIPVIICSILEEKEKGLSLGATDYLVKPFLQDELAGALNRLNRLGQVRKVLVIDDDPDDLRLVQKTLDSNGSYEITLAEGGKAGLEQLQAQPPDAIILDLMMPEVDGFAILEKVFENPKLCDIPILVLTGADLNPIQVQLLTEYGQHFLNKGALRENELLNTLDTILRQAK
jgi:signal transduction histidine kinase/DNA-binding response OmpR family regulator